MNRDSPSTFGRRVLRLGGVGLLLVGGVALGLLGWQWRANVTVARVTVAGTQHAAPDTVRRLARVDSGTAMMEVEPTLVADRAARHPWVKGATVETKWMHGVLALTVTERTPAALALDTRGRPAYYLDRGGHAMPLPDSAGYDVPLVRGLGAEVPWTRPDTVQSPSSLRRVLRALPETGVADLVAEIEVQSDDTIRLTTTPIGAHEALPVHLGNGDVPQKLRTLRAFARQVLTTSPEEPIEHIDLRFDEQVVTRTQSLDG
ncbi:cell division protein FtsQ/DivIB [Salinibacter altiplanensis]|uniref:cell division protein FtsQ/DivIB n=1 Tax=Salinibacter altiplanensis TaxID=1803181 RepID=UPI000C9ED917|nr:FtsQ-type POTRA domain-containing protein [Salinibacter altiplanensis]